MQKVNALVPLTGVPACRLPGQIDSPSLFWDLILAGGSPPSEKVPQNRFNVDAFYNPNNERPGSFNIRGGYFLDGDPAEFDPTFFGITPVEATWMDPQQRKLLEVAYEALESSGTHLQSVRGSLTGCFIGSFTNDFQQISFKENDFRHTYTATGVDPGILANRLAHVFDLRGPSAVINTACSSSLAALHMACSAIRNHDCEAALVGGSNLILTPDQHMNTAKLGVLSPTSRCRTFDESADGYARAEGVGALYIKSLATALKDGDPIRAVICSTAMNSNSNGRTPGVGISHPSLQGQCDVIRSAYQKAGLDPTETSYVECHGTGTPAGDPIELQAISQALVTRCERSLPLLVGSVKPNIGHSEASSSIATIIKLVLAIEKNLIPPTAGIVNLNPKILWKEWHIQPVTIPTKFPTCLPSIRASVNASGYGGTNSHAILENFQAADQSPQTYKSARRMNGPDSSSETSLRPCLLVFSAHDKITLARNIKAHSNMKFSPELIDLAYTLAQRRSVFAFRAYATCRQESFGADILNALETARETVKPPTIAFAFTGQGAQWRMMGSRLFEAFPSYAQTIRELDQVLARLTDSPSWTIEGCLADTDSPFSIDHPEISQPLCTAVQIGLVQLLAKWNILPEAVVGHSSGEIAAAFTAGYLSAEDAIRIAFYRGKVVASASACGAMLAVSLGAAEVLPYLEAHKNGVVVACHNSPHSVTLSGNAKAIGELKEYFETKGIFVRELRTAGKAYHSHHMTPVATEYKDLLESKDLSAARMPPTGRRCRMMSTVSNAFLADKRTDPAYWALNLENPVLFSQAIARLTHEMPHLDTIVEIGPHPALSGPIRQISAATDKVLSYLPTLKREENDVDQLLTLAGELWARNSPIDISEVTSIERSSSEGIVESVSGSLLVDLPPYQWNYSKKYVSEPRQSREHRGCQHARHDLLGRKIPGLSLAEPQWRNVLRLADLPWLKDHTE
ncbi:MAG: hypothetical protein LQ344_001761 [Seirophora lacunosa]|nr:MAG: hypothetical protein LQ344_001761 [Seirophora lacunosa]